MSRHRSAAMPLVVRFGEREEVLPGFVPAEGGSQACPARAAAADGRSRARPRLTPVAVAGGPPVPGDRYRGARAAALRRRRGGCSR